MVTTTGLAPPKPSSGASRTPEPESVRSEALLIPQQIEYEVQLAEMESRLRQMITEVLKPTIVKTSRLQSDHNIMCLKFQEMVDSYQDVMTAHAEVKENTKKMTLFRDKLDEFWSHGNAVEDAMATFQKETLARFEEVNQLCLSNRSSAERVDRQIDAAMKDMDGLTTVIQDMQVTLDDGIQRNKDSMETELRQHGEMVREVRMQYRELEQQIWGDEDMLLEGLWEASTPSLRRLDMQMRDLNGSLGEARHEIRSLCRLERELAQLSTRQNECEARLKEFAASNDQVRERCETVTEGVKQDFSSVSNRLAANTANLVREARQAFNDELRELRRMQQELCSVRAVVEKRSSETDEHVNQINKQVEANLHEVRIDISTLEGKRKRDKQGGEEELRMVHHRVAGQAEATSSLFRALEHVTGVISMTLQSDRMSVALDLQEYLERKETTLVGASDPGGGEEEKQHSEGGVEASRFRGVDPTSLHRLVYRPQPITYQGMNFERPQLIALREKLVHVAQEVLLQGPVAPPDGSQMTKQKLAEESIVADSSLPSAKTQVPASSPSFGEATTRYSSRRSVSRGPTSMQGSPATGAGETPVLSHSAGPGGGWPQRERAATVCSAQPQASARATSAPIATGAKSKATSTAGRGTAIGLAPGVDPGVQLPTLAATEKQTARTRVSLVRDNLTTAPAALSAR